MRRLLFLLASVFVSCCNVKAQDAALVALSQKEAVREFPQLAVPGSSLNKRFLERVSSLKYAHDSVLLRDDWPLLITKQVALEVGEEPVPREKPAPVVPDASPTPTPWVPKGSMLDNNPGSSDASTLDPMNPKSSGASSGEKFYIVGKVVMKDDDGLLINCQSVRTIGAEAVSGQVWLTGRDSSLGHLVKTLATKVGVHTYVTVTGLKRKVEEYKAAD